MGWILNYILYSILVSLMSVLFYLTRNNNDKSGKCKLPPGPRGWPIIGNILDLGTLPHRSLAALKQEYGPVVWLNLGSVKAMAILSAGAAEELFKNHDASFSDRIVVETVRSYGYYKSSIAFVPYGSYWRTIRRIGVVELFSHKRISEAKLKRRNCVDDMLLWIEKEIKKGAGGIEVVPYFVFPTMFNMIGSLVLSRDHLVDPSSEVASEFYSAMAGYAECLSVPNVSDLFVWLRRLDLQGLRRRMDGCLGKTIDIASKYVKERVEQRQQHKLEGIRSSERTNDFLDALLDFEGNEKDELVKLSEHQIKISVMDIFMAGTETTTTAIEWALSELLLNPAAMTKIKEELARVVGENKKLEERDVDNLHYLRAAVEETLRLHPPAALIPRKTNCQITNFMGYTIPENTQVLINAWAIGRDENFWNDASSFKPERFLDSNIEYKGQHFDFMPFGAGRRMCPAVGMAHVVLPFLLGSLLYNFDWELCGGETTLDMKETMGATTKKLKPLKVVPKLAIHMK